MNSPKNKEKNSENPSQSDENFTIYQQKNEQNNTTNTNDKSPTLLYRFDTQQNENTHTNKNNQNSPKQTQQQQQQQKQNFLSQNSDLLLSSNNSKNSASIKSQIPSMTNQNQTIKNCSNFKGNDNGVNSDIFSQVNPTNPNKNYQTNYSFNQNQIISFTNPNSNDCSQIKLKNTNINDKPVNEILTPVHPNEVDNNQTITVNNSRKDSSNYINSNNIEIDIDLYKDKKNNNSKNNAPNTKNRQMQTHKKSGDLQIKSDKKNQENDKLLVKNSNQQSINPNFRYIVKPQGSIKNDQKNQKINHKYQQQIQQFQKLQQQQLKEIKQKNQHIPSYLKEEEQLDADAAIWKNWDDLKKPKINENFNIFKIPKITNGPENSTIIGVIDQSGSMQDCFQWLASEWNEQIRDKYQKTKCCIFHNLAYEAPCLQKEPEMGTTEVEAGFTLLNSVLMQQEVGDNITVIFVSDGQDNNQETIFERLDKLMEYIPKYKKINFLTIGVGEQFPTYLAMQLRQMYHTGENTIPPVFLVHNQHIHENWKVTFKLVNKYLQHNSPVNTEQHIQNYPWSQPQNIHYENSYIFTNDMDLKSIKIKQANNCGTDNDSDFNENNNNYKKNMDHENQININQPEELEIQPIQKLEHQEILQIGSFMLSNIQLRNLKYNNLEATKKEATIAYKILNNLKQKWWGKSRKKLEERMQIETLISELQSLIKEPDLKKNHLQGEDKDRNLALKLAVGGIAAGIGLYWLSENYGAFSNLMGGMSFAGDSCFGSCGCLDQCAQCVGCESCGQCFADIFSTGKDCIGTGCVYICKVMEYLGGLVCSVMGE